MSLTPHPRDPDNESASQISTRSDAVHDRVQEHLAALDQRYTSGRRRLIELLVATSRPASLPELLALDPSIPQSSLYRNLDMLERTGLVRRLATGGEHARFEFAEPLLAHHHHLICVSCGLIEDVTFADAVEIAVDDALHEAALDYGFEPLHHSLDLHGRCSDCTTQN